MTPLQFDAANLGALLAFVLMAGVVIWLCIARCQQELAERKAEHERRRIVHGFFDDAA